VQLKTPSGLPDGVLCFVTLACCYSIESMFEQSEGPRKTAQVSIAMSVGIYAAYLIGAFGGTGLFIIFEDRPFGVQIATVITYTYFVFWYVFFPTRGLLEKYSLRNKAVQQQFPRLLTIHCAFLILIFFGQTVLFAIRPRLPSYWLTGHGKQGDTLNEGVLIGSFVAVFFTQVLISRGILSRRLKENSDKSDVERIGP